MSETVASQIGEVLLVVGALQLAGAALVLGMNTVRRRGCVRLSGAIVDHDAQPDEDGTYHRPIVEYTAPNREKRRLKYPLSFPAPLATDGSEHRVVWHHPTDAVRSHVDAKVKYRLPPTVMYVLPFVVLGLGAALRFGGWG